MSAGGQVVIPPDFYDTPEDIIAACEGNLDVGSDEPAER